MAWRDSRASRRKLALFSSSIILGVLFGGALISPNVATALLSFDCPVIDTGINYLHPDLAPASLRVPVTSYRSRTVGA